MMFQSILVQIIASKISKQIILSEKDSSITTHTLQRILKLRELGGCTSAIRGKNLSCKMEKLVGLFH